MYGKSQKSVQICSRCLSRLPIRAPFPSRLLLTRSQSSLSNAQSTWQHGRDDNDNDKPHDGSNRKFQRQSNLGHRHFRPYQSAELGLQSLGKPAEVLILPSRNRRLPNTLIETVKEEESPVHTAYSHDSEPVSWDEIQKNLMAVRESVVPKDMTFVNVEKWTKLKILVSTSFTKEQLVKYLNENATSQLSIHAKSESADKRALADNIMRRVWQLVKSKAVECKQTGDGHADTEESTDVSEQIKTNGQMLHVALNTGGQTLKKISEECEVRIDVFQDDSKVSVTGTPAAVYAAKQKLRQELARPPPNRTIELRDSLKALARTSAFDRYLRALMQKYPIHIVRKNVNLTLLAMEESTLDIVHQDLIRLIRTQHRNAGYTFLGDKNFSKMTKVTMYLSTFSNWLQQQQTWYRWRYSDRSEQCGNPPSDDNIMSVTLRAKQELTQHWLPSIQDAQRVFTCQPDSLKSVMVANIGQALFNGDKQAPTLMQSAFASNIPLLPQALASRELSLTVKSRERCLRLQFQPQDQGAKLPTIEIFMTGERIDHGLDQALKMAKVQLKLGTAVHDILLPSEQLDIQLTKSTLVEVFNSERGSSLPQHSSFLHSIATIIESLQAQESQSQNPTYKLNLLPLLSNIPEFPNSTSSSSSTQAEAKHALLDEVTGLLLPTVRDRKNKTHPATYFLEPPQWQDKVTYSHAWYPGIKIEHTVIGPLADDGSISQQQITLEPSTDHPSILPQTGRASSGDDQFDSVLRAAIELSRKLTSCSRATNELSKT